MVISLNQKDSLHISFFLITASNQAKAGECGAIKVISDAMKKHTRDANVCRSGCGALGNITMDGNLFYKE